MPASGGLNYIYDATIVIQPTGSDDGVITGRSNAGSSVTLYADRVTIRQERDTADHSAGMEEVELERTRKWRQSAHFEAKMFQSSANLFQRLNGLAGDIVSFTITGTGGGISGTAIVKNSEGEYGAPSIHRFDLGSYGTWWTATG
jgi:hypothetical protein